MRLSLDKDELVLHPSGATERAKASEVRKRELF